VIEQVQVYGFTDADLAAESLRDDPDPLVEVVNVLREAAKSKRMMTPKDVARAIGVSDRHARDILRAGSRSGVLVKKWAKRIEGGQRVTYWFLTEKGSKL